MRLPPSLFLHQEVTMTAREQLLEEIEQAPDFLVEEVLNFLLFIKARRALKEPQSINQSSVQAQLQAMSADPDIRAEIAAINNEFANTEMDGLSKL